MSTRRVTWITIYRLGSLYFTFPLSETKEGKFPGVAWWFFYFRTTHFLGRTFMSTDVVFNDTYPFCPQWEELKGGSLQLCYSVGFIHLFADLLSDRASRFLLFVGVLYGITDMRENEIRLSVSAEEGLWWLAVYIRFASRAFKKTYIIILLSVYFAG